MTLNSTPNISLVQSLFTVNYKYCGFLGYDTVHSSMQVHTAFINKKTCSKFRKYMWKFVILLLLESDVF
jgi:hypothetical protein